MERQQDQNAGENLSTTQVITDEAQSVSVSEELVLRFEPSNEQRVQWTTDTIDNENLGKKKSKCCCIFKKKRNWNESDSSESDCETGRCRGHVEKNKKNDEEKRNDENPSNSTN